MARLEEVITASRLGDGELRDLLAIGAADTRPADAPPAPGLVAQWQVDAHSGWLTCCWVVAAR